MFLSPEKLLGDVLRLRPYTREGQWAAASMVVDLAEHWNLGIAEILAYPERPDGTGEKFPLVKIISESGPGSGQHSRKLMTWLGHLDTVEPQSEQLQEDPLVLTPVDTPSGRKTKGKGRGTIDMWGGNIAYLCALAMLRERGARFAVQTILSSREEAGSEVLHQALQRGDIERARVGATTEILVADTGSEAPLYRGRTGRIGIDVTFKGAAPHAGAVDRQTGVIAELAHRALGRAIDEMFDETRGYYLANAYPDDTHNLLPRVSHAIPGSIHGEPQGLSVPGEITQRFNVFHSDPNLPAERVREHLEGYLLSKRIQKDKLEVRLQERHGVPFIEPWLTPHDHALAIMGHRYAEAVSGQAVRVVAANGVAEEGMIFHRLGTKFVGWSPVGKDAHEPGEYVIMETIEERAEWLSKLAQHDGDLD